MDKIIQKIALCTICLLSFCSCEQESEGQTLISGADISIPIRIEGVCGNEEEGMTRTFIPEGRVISDSIIPLDDDYRMECELREYDIPATRSVLPLPQNIQYRVIFYEKDNISASGYVCHYDCTSGTGVAATLKKNHEYTVVSYTYGLMQNLPAFSNTTLSLNNVPSTAMYCKQNFTAALGSTLSILFERVFATLKIRLENPNALDPSLQNVSVKAYQSGKLELTSGGCSTSGASLRDIVYPWSNFQWNAASHDYASSSDTNYFLSGGTSFSYTINGLSTGSSGPAKSPTVNVSPVNIQAGKRYLLKIRVTEFSVTFRTVNPYLKLSPQTSGFPGAGQQSQSYKLFSGQSVTMSTSPLYNTTSHCQPEWSWGSGTVNSHTVTAQSADAGKVYSFYYKVLCEFKADPTSSGSVSNAGKWYSTQEGMISSTATATNGGRFDGWYKANGTKVTATSGNVYVTNNTLYVTPHPETADTYTARFSNVSNNATDKSVLFDGTRIKYPWVYFTLVGGEFEHEVTCNNNTLTTTIQKAYVKTGTTYTATSKGEGNCRHKIIVKWSAGGGETTIAESSRGTGTRTVTFTLTEAQVTATTGHLVITTDTGG